MSPKRPELRMWLIAVAGAVLIVAVGYVYVTSNAARHTSSDAKHAADLARQTARYARRREAATRRQLVHVCQAVNQNGHNLTVEHKKTRELLLGAYRNSLRRAMVASTAAERVVNLHAAAEYRSIALTYKPFIVVACRVPRLRGVPPSG